MRSIDCWRKFFQPFSFLKAFSNEMILLFKIFLSNDKIQSWCTQWEKERVVTMKSLRSEQNIHTYVQSCCKYLTWPDWCQTHDWFSYKWAKLCTVSRVTQFQIDWSQAYQYLFVSIHQLKLDLCIFKNKSITTQNCPFCIWCFCICICICW